MTSVAMTNGSSTNGTLVEATASIGREASRLIDGPILPDRAPRCPGNSEISPGKNPGHIGRPVSAV